MGDKTDPRLHVLWSDQWRDDGMDNDLRLRFLAVIDAADRAAGIVRVDTNDEALVERLAEVLAHNLDDEPYWSCAVIAKNILAALREAS